MKKVHNILYLINNNLIKRLTEIPPTTEVVGFLSEVIMTIDELRIRLAELKVEYSHNPKITKELQKDIISLDSIMRKNFDAYWDDVDKNYTQSI